MIRSPIVNHEHPLYIREAQKIPNGSHNGAYYYSKEICENIIPKVLTLRPWVTIHVKGVCYDHAIVFIHSNVNLEQYEWLKDYDDLILVCSNHDTAKGLEHIGRTVFLPLSVDVDYVNQFRQPKTEKACYAGNRWKFKEDDLAKYVPADTHWFPNLPREKLLPMVAKYKECYAIGRTAIEAKILGCEIKVCDHRFPDPDFWQVIDNSEAVNMLQAIIDEIDG